MKKATATKMTAKEVKVVAEAIVAKDFGKMAQKETKSCEQCGVKQDCPTAKYNEPCDMYVAPKASKRNAVDKVVEKTEKTENKESKMTAKKVAVKRATVKETPKAVAKEEVTVKAKTVAKKETVAPAVRKASNPVEGKYGDWKREDLYAELTKRGIRMPGGNVTKALVRELLVTFDKDPKGFIEAQNTKKVKEVKPVAKKTEKKAEVKAEAPKAEVKKATAKVAPKKTAVKKTSKK